MATWFLLADPETYSFARLEADGRAVWDGITGAPAQKHLRSAKQGDRAFVYETAPTKALVGLAAITSDPRRDPSDEAGKRVVVDVKPVHRFAKPVPLDALVHAPELAAMTFVRVKRVAVSPVSPAEERALLRLAGEK